MVEEKGAGEALHFSYPSPILEPHYSDETVAITRELGFLTAVTCTRGSVGKGDEPLSLKRIWVPAHPVDFSWEIEKAFSGR
jgi:hypothetical protein